MPSSSTTDGLSMPSSIFDHKPHDKSKMNAFSTQLKKHFQDCEDARGRGVVMVVRSDLRWHTNEVGERRAVYFLTLDGARQEG